MKNIVILVSGSGSNLQRIIDCIESQAIPDAKINLVIADRDCYALKRAENHGIKNILIKRGKSFSEELKDHIPKNTDLIVLAGFLSIISKEFCEKFKGKIINIHPSLLPKFGGKGMWGHHVHEAVLKSGEKESGATVHFVNPGIDEGKIIVQGKVNIEENETPETLAQKIHEVEYDIFPKAINTVLSNKLKLDIELLGIDAEYSLIDFADYKNNPNFSVVNEKTDQIQQLKNIAFHTKEAVFIYTEIKPKQELRFKYALSSEMVCQYFVLEGFTREESPDGVRRITSKSGEHNIVYWKDWEGVSVYEKDVFIKTVTVYLKKSFFLKCLRNENNILDEGFTNLKADENWRFGSSMGKINDEIRNLINEIINTKRQGVYLKLFLESKLKELLLLQIEAFAEKDTKKDETKTASEKMAQEIHKIIRDNTFEELSLKEIAKKLGSNVSTISRAFKESYNISIFQFWNNLRFNEAKELLLNEKSIKEVSIILGYMNPNHFSTGFKRHFGMTPTKFLEINSLK